MDNNENPFRAPEGYFQVKFIVPNKAVESAEAAFEDVSVSTSSFEVDPEGVNWLIEILLENEPLPEELTARIGIMAHLAQIDEPKYEVTYIKQRDWVSEVQKTFVPITAGRFYIYGSHHKELPPAGFISIQIDAGQAFGSGEHETTSACLEALDALAKTHDFRNMLDMGCGSGILAMAMAKTWKKSVLAADIDPIAVQVTQENVTHNHEAQLVQAYVSDGYTHPKITEHAPYDLIVANILARPLMELAPDLEAHLAKNGIVVLSGLLARQEDDVLAAHAKVGLGLKACFAKNGWNTLVLERRKDLP